MVSGNVIYITIIFEYKVPFFFKISFLLLILCIYESLPEGHQQIEDVTIISSSDFERFLEYDESKENGSDFDGFQEKDDLDDESLKRIAVEEIEDILLGSDVDKSEILHVFKMEGFKSSVKVCIDNQSEFIRSKIDGKVFKKGRWISARDVVIKVKLL